MAEKAKISIQTTKKGKKVGHLHFDNGKEIAIPKHYIIDETLNGKECQVEREGGKVEGITIDGIALRKEQEKNTFSERHSKKNNKAGGNASKQNEKSTNLYSIENSSLPADTLAKLKIKGEEIIDNISLKLNKTVNFDKDNKTILHKNRSKNRDTKTFEYFEIPLPKFPESHRDIISRHRKISGNAYTTTRFNLTTDWRMVVGLGNASVYETSMTLHHIYGIPYIPGQAIKGTTRNNIIINCFDSEEKDALKDELFCRIFGSPKESELKEHKGEIFFLDSFPLNTPHFKMDVMTPHYGDYYSEKAPPADYLSPNPIPFLTVENGEFEIILGTSKNKTETDITKWENSPLYNKIEDKKATTLLDTAEYWVKNALTEQGVGAKTAVGYGYFNE